MDFATHGKGVGYDDLWIACTEEERPIVLRYLKDSGRYFTGFTGAKGSVWEGLLCYDVAFSADLQEDLDAYVTNQLEEEDI